MKPPRTTAPWLRACLLGLAASCSGSAQPALRPMVAPVPPPPSRPSPPDVSEVPRPASVLAVVRLAPLTSLLGRVGELTGMGNTLRDGLDDFYRLVLGDGALAGAIDQNAPVDVIFDAGASEDNWVVAFGAPTIDRLEELLGQTHRLVPAGNGTVRIEPGEGHRRHAYMADDPPINLSHCVATATPVPSMSRIVCSGSDAVVDALAPWAARTLTRREPAAYTIALELQLDAVRAHYQGEMLHYLDHLRAAADWRLDHLASTLWHHPSVHAAVMPIVTDLLDNARTMIPEATRADVTVTLETDHVTAHAALGLRNPTGPLVRGLLDGLRDQPAPPPELLAHLPPEGYAYVAGTWDLRPWRTLIARLPAVGAALFAQDRAFNPTQQTALRQALEGLAVADQLALGLATGYDDQGRTWFAGALRPSTVAPTELVTHVRTLVHAMQTPAARRFLASVLGAELAREINVSELRELPAAQLPPGAYGFALPGLPVRMNRGPLGSLMEALGMSSPPGSYGPSAPPAGGMRAGALRATPRMPPTQVLLVPSGHDLLFVAAPDARAAFARYQSTATPGVDPAVLHGAHSAVTYALVPAGLANSLRQSMPAAANALTLLTHQMVDHGRTPIAVRLGATSEPDGTAVLAVDLDVRSQTFSVFRMLSALFANP